MSNTPRFDPEGEYTEMLFWVYGETPLDPSIKGIPDDYIWAWDQKQMLKDKSWW